MSRFPDQSASEYDWASQLANTESYTATLDADWIIHNDADELRYSPWSGVSLRNAISFVDHLGYSAIDFTLVNFRFLSDSVASAPFERSLLRYEFGDKPGPVAIKLILPVVVFFHSIFLSKHYPLRTPEQAERKLHIDRLPRVDRERSELGWHGHYNELAKAGVVEGWKPASLQGWHEPFFRTEFLVER